MAIGISFLLRAAWLDRRLQRFRARGLPAASYLGKFGRWRRELYTVEGQPLIAATRFAFSIFCVAALLGVLLIENSAH
jgi:hypothetical protein